MFYCDWLESARRSAIERLLSRSATHGQSVRRQARPGRARHHAELLERRLVLSGGGPIASPPITATPISGGSGNSPSVLSPNISAPFSPANIQSAYGINSITFSGASGTGAGQTIAIIDAYNDPNILSDAATFNTRFGLPQFNTTGNPTFQILNQNGSASSLPANATSSNGGWDTEISLDVEWAHAVAPQANIILFEANSASSSDLYAAVATAANYAGVSAVSMSFGSSEFSSEHNYDATFTTPSGHQGVTFLASTGDSNAPAEYPAYSPNVVAVGGTSLAINTDGSYGSESAWGNVSSGSGGGGGISAYETQPSFQSGKINGLSATKRTAPDVSMLADPSTGVYMYDSWAGGSGTGGYYIAGGTSLAAPMWAGLIAIANQDRALAGLATLDGASQTLPRLYQLGASNFHDITTGNNGYNAGAGYDLATGIGTPAANLLVPALAGVTQTPTHLAFSAAPSNAAAGAAISPAITVQVLDAFGALVTTDSSSVTLSFGANPGGGTLGGTTTLTAVNGIATFSGVSISKAASGYTLVATDGSLASATSGSFTISPAVASQLAISNQPGSGTVGVPLAPAITVTVKDAYGNVCSSNSSVVTLTLNSGSFVGGATTSGVSAVNGVATFSNLALATAGAFTLTASDGALAAATTLSFTIAKATPTVFVTAGGGTYNGTAYGATGAGVTDANTGAAVASFGSGLLSYSYYAGTLTAGQVSGATPLGGAPLLAGAYTVVATFAGSSNYNSASSLPANFTIAQRALHVTASAQSRVYDGTTGATVTLSDDRVAGDTLTLSYGSAAFADKNVNTAIAVNVAGIAMSGASIANYTLANTTAVTSANITPLAISGSITASSKTYDGATAATLATRSLTGVLNGDAVSLAGGSATFNSKDVGSAAAVTATGLTLTGPQAGDYSLSNPIETASASITPLGITGSITAGNKVYDNTPAATIAIRTLTGVLGSDDVALSGGSASFNSKDVDTATTVTASGLTLVGAQAGDYVLLNPTESTAASITPLSITGSIIASGKIYDQTAAATVSGMSIAGVLGSDQVSLSGGVATFNSRDVSTATTVTDAGLALSGADADNYFLANPTETASASIAPATVWGSVVCFDKVYDGGTSATYSVGPFSGLFAGDGLTLIGGTARFNSKDVASATTVTVTGLSLGGAQASDYTLANSTESAAASISPLGVVGSITASDKVYDATNSATLSTRTLAGILNGDDVQLVGVSAAFNSAQVSGASLVTASGLSLTGAQAGDYTLTNPTETAPAHITPRPLTGAITAANKVYDGGAAAVILSRTLSGALNGDDVSLSGGVAVFNSKDVDLASSVTAGGLALVGAAASNYTLANPTESAGAFITPLPVTGAIVANDKIYDGTATASLASRTLTGAIAGDDVYLVGGPAQFNSADVASAATVSTTGSLAGAQADDYLLSNPTETASARITPLPLTASIAAAGKVYDGAAAAALTGESVSGVVGSDDVSLAGGYAAFDTPDAGIGKTVTASNLLLTGAQAADYTLANPNPTTTANIAPLSITGSFVAASKTYDGTLRATAASTSLAGVLGSDRVLETVNTATFDTKDVGIGKTVTAAGITLTGAQAADYALSNPTQTATAGIAPLAIAASVAASGKTYDGTTAATLTSRTLTGGLSGDTVALVGGSATFNSKDVGSATTVTATGLALSGAQAGDYTLASSTARCAASISPRPLTGSIAAASKTYDGGTLATVWQQALLGVVGGDSVAITAGSAAFDTKDAGTGKAVTATRLFLTGPQAADYSLANTTETAVADITPRAITGGIIVAAKTYDGTTAANLAGRTLAGVVAGDDVSLVGGEANFDSADVATASVVTASGLSLAGAQAGDYVLANPTETAPGSIAPRGIAGSVVVADKLFDASAAATITSRTLAGVLGNDDVALVGGAASFDTPAVGGNKTVAAAGLSLSGAQAGDYALLNPTETTTASILPLVINGTVFNDSNGDGLAQAGEAGLAGRIVTLQFAGRGTRGQKTARTDINGNFSFTDLAIGSYVVKVSLPAHWRRTSSSAPALTATLQPGGAIQPLQFGQTNAASVSGSVFLDANRNGKRQAGEAGLAGWRVALSAPGGGTALLTATTDASGAYSFTNVPVGTYRLSVIEPGGFVATGKSKAFYIVSLSPSRIVNNENFGQILATGLRHHRAKLHRQA